MNWQIFNAPEYLNLKSCLFSGQVFSFYIDTNKKHKENLIDFIKKNNFLESIKENNIANLEIFNGLINKTEYLLCQFNNLIFYSTDDKESIENLNIFFGFNLRYKKIFKNWEFEYNGLRLLRIDIVENILSFVCSQNNNIRRISKMVIYLREKSDNFRVLDFDEDDLRKEGFGYRAKYIMNVCKEINKLQDIENSKMEYKENVENQIEENFKLQDKEKIKMEYKEIIKFQIKENLELQDEENGKMEYNELKKEKNVESNDKEKRKMEKNALKIEKFFELQDVNREFNNLKFLKNVDDIGNFLIKIKGIGRKVRDCILLMGFGFVNVVPIDTHVFKVSKKLFNLEHKNLNDKNYKEIQEKFKEKYGEFCGIAQLYLFRKSIEDKKF